MRKFDFVVGNPPYQTKNSKTSNYQPSIYHEFISQAMRVGWHASLITPARWLFDVGGTPHAWNVMMLSNPHISWWHYFPDSSVIFPSVQIAGGVVISGYNAHASYEPIGFFTAHPMQREIAEQVTSHPDFKPIHELIGYKTAPLIIPCNSNSFALHPEIFTEKPTRADDVPIRGRYKCKRVGRYVARNLLKANADIGGGRVIHSKADDRYILPRTEIMPPNTTQNQSFTEIGKFATRVEAERLSRYLGTRFARALLKTVSTTHKLGKNELGRYIPKQDFSDHSDIDGSQPLDDIDLQLFAKYGITPEQREYINATIKPGPKEWQ